MRSLFAVSLSPVAYAPAQRGRVGELSVEVVAPRRHGPHARGVLALGVALHVAREDACGLAVLLLVVALHGGEVERLLGELRLLAEGEAEEELHGLAALRGVGGLHEYGGAVELGVGGVLALWVEPDGPRERLGVVGGRAEVVERGGAHVVRDAVRVEDAQLGAALLVVPGEGAHEARAVGPLRGRILLEELSVRAARVSGASERAVAFRKAVQHLLGGERLLAGERGVLGAGRGVFAAVEEPVGHREAVCRQDGHGRHEKRERRHFPAPSPSPPSVASEKFQMSDARQVSMSFTSVS